MRKGRFPRSLNEGRGEFHAGGERARWLYVSGRTSSAGLVAAARDRASNAARGVIRPLARWSRVSFVVGNEAIDLRLQLRDRKHSRLFGVEALEGLVEAFDLPAGLRMVGIAIPAALAASTNPAWMLDHFQG